MRKKKTASNRSLLALLIPVEIQGNKPGGSSVRYPDSSLTWQTSYGSLLPAAVSVYISYTGRTDYICKYRCSSGFFNPRRRSYCQYPFGGREHQEFPFQLLVNKDNFEILEWKGDKWGDGPHNSVQTCSGGDVYVGKNKYDLGKGHTIHNAFFLPWEGREYWYKHYEVLTLSKKFNTEQMFNVKNNLDVTVTEHPPVEKTVELQRTRGHQH